jgi:hypothetical protein
LGELRDGFVHFRCLQELDLAVEIKVPIPNLAPTADAVADVFMDHLSPEFSSVRKLVLRIGWSAVHYQNLLNVDDPVEVNPLQGETGQFRKLDERLGSSACLLRCLDQVVVEVKLKEWEREQNPGGEMEPWILKRARDDVLSVMPNARFRFDFSVESIREPRSEYGHGTYWSLGTLRHYC